MEQLLNTIAQFIQVYGIWFIILYIVCFAASALVFISSFLVIVKVIRNISERNRRYW